MTWSRRRQYARAPEARLQRSSLCDLADPRGCLLCHVRLLLRVARGGSRGMDAACVRVQCGRSLTQQLVKLEATKQASHDTPFWSVLTYTHSIPFWFYSFLFGGIRWNADRPRVCPRLWLGSPHPTSWSPRYAGLLSAALIADSSRPHTFHSTPPLFWQEGRC